MTAPAAAHAGVTEDFAATAPLVLIAGRLSEVLNSEGTADGASRTRPVDDPLDPIPKVISRPASGAAATVREPAWPAVLTVVALGAAVVLTVLMLVQTHRLPTLQGLLAGPPSRPLAPIAAPIAPVIWPTETMTASLGAKPPEAEAGVLLLRAGPAAVERPDKVASVLKAAENRLADGDVIGARLLLLTVVATGGPEAKLALAETYDPNALAAWGLVDAVPDVRMARDLYAEAHALGHAKAHRRLELLP